MLKELLVESSVSGKIRKGIHNQSREPANSALWYFIGLPLMLGLSSYVTWNSIVIPIGSIPMAVGCGLAYLATWFNRYRSSSYMAYRTYGLSILILTLSFIALLTILASFRLNYSRWFLLISYSFTFSWFTAGVLLFKESARNFMIIKGGITNKLKKLSQEHHWPMVHRLPEKPVLNEYDAIVIDMHEHSDPQLLKQIADASLHGVSVKHAATVFEEYSGRSDLDYLAHEGLYDLVRNKVYVALKRGWETLFIVLSSIFIVPLAAFTALCIKLESRGPVLFTQQRIGKDGETFTLYKFRSMTVKSETNGAQFAGEEDNRITRVGRFIRKFRIDEIPQFWNVLRGEMSLIGPRPEQKHFVEFFNEEIPFYSYRHKVRPGITGWAQTKDGYADDVETTRRKLEYDLYYVKNISLSLDILIVYMTIKTIFTGFGAR
ncbi:exopolysaccharide biosynthesis polyprenyl glycosylphosphotransferase [Balneolaceae bacterium YR4-1]|uniref:Exopolysaccharide biosynthesis polyprenyl glycosylphosphotransferase n=1 Tax=Halalkalibaculum roseum TaxID=2709311 RepID=A0A6M1ST30_9BACT|nr:exopolysaccharide biosynthesis polyprenyl glycosylphosphotransferase [Halalkalibaculum roseum]NGP75952.1 exopolysaccharide biosynthesis polyprenyl glycosylphosphotransferase [Halalkalibaculum roseum]